VFVALAIPTDDRTPFEALVDQTVAFVEQLAAQTPPERPLYLMGESFGGVLAIAVAARARDAVDRLLLINPATCFEETAWPQVRLPHGLLLGRATDSRDHLADPR